MFRKESCFQQLLTWVPHLTKHLKNSGIIDIITNLYVCNISESLIMFKSQPLHALSVFADGNILNTFLRFTVIHLVCLDIASYYFVSIFRCSFHYFYIMFLTKFGFFQIHRSNSFPPILIPSNQFLLPIHSWMGSFPLEYGQYTSNKFLKNNDLFPKAIR